jgi:acyl-CoA reductase-like NAD-dependent aldehyde dehydrogenase
MKEHNIILDQFLNGKSLKGDGQEHEIINPFDNSIICKIKSASEDQVNEAINNAYETYRSNAWKKMLGRERGGLL